MNFLLKIVEGPNKGAEIALVEGVSVTLGKGDDCDIVLADPSLPDAPVAIEATGDAVLLDGEPLEQLHVRTLGATSLAVGPASGPWGELVWPKSEEENQEDEEKQQTDQPTNGPTDQPTNGLTDQRTNGPTGQPTNGPTDQPTNRPTDQPTKGPSRPRRGGLVRRLVGAAVLVVVILALLLLARCSRESRLSRASRESSESVESTLASLIERYGLSLSEGEGGAVSLSGNLATRSERLAATAEAYATKPGINLDLTDDESFRTAAEDALFTITEGALKVLSATNRVVVIGGSAASPADLEATLRALAADLPRMRDADVSAVAVANIAAPQSAATAAASRRAAASRQAALPVCGILTSPYPCLVMRDGSRVLEGAAIGDSVVLKIEADSVILTNSTGRVEWKP